MYFSKKKFCMFILKIKLLEILIKNIELDKLPKNYISLRKNLVIEVINM